MMNHKEIAAVVAGVVPAVKEFLDKSLGAFNARLSAVEARAPEKGDPGTPGENGKDADQEKIAALVSSEVAKAVDQLPKAQDGKSVTIDDVRPLIEEIVGKIPMPKDGKDADQEKIAAFVSSEIAKAVDQLPKAQDGKSVMIDDVRPIIEELVAKIPQAKDGSPGTKGDNGVPGRDGLNVDECLVPDDLALDVGKGIALLAESPPIVPKSVAPIAVTITERQQQNKTMKITRDKKDGSVTAEFVSTQAE